PPASSPATPPDPAGTRSPAGAAPTPSTSSPSSPTPRTTAAQGPDPPSRTPTAQKGHRGRRSGITYLSPSLLSPTDIWEQGCSGRRVAPCRWSGRRSPALHLKPDRPPGAVIAGEPPVAGQLVDDE